MSSSILFQETLKAFKIWIDVQENGGLRVNFAHAMIGCHHEKDSFLPFEGAFKIMFHH